jgi:hypothetical protein
MSKPPGLSPRRHRPQRAGSSKDPNSGRPGTGFQRPSFYGSHPKSALASPVFGGGSVLRPSRAESHSAVQRTPRSHSSASLRSKSALALSSSARASLRYRAARALLMASQVPTRQNKDSSAGRRFGSWPALQRRRADSQRVARAEAPIGRPDLSPRPRRAPAVFRESPRWHSVAWPGPSLRARDKHRLHELRRWQRKPDPGLSRLFQSF